MEVQKLLDVSDKVGKFYDKSLKEDLKVSLNELQNKIEDFFEKKASIDKSLLKDTVYKSVAPFSYKSRVKDSLSIKEKIIRREINFEEISKENLLKYFDDLIGITILTTTMWYQDAAFKYLEEFLNENTENIEILSGMNKKKPIFDNDNIKYYHIKFKYNGYPVEVQIKSIFLSAFADIEHTLFYKDHEIHELKNYNKKIMHSLAPMLINLEEILHGIYSYDNSYIESELLKTKIYNFIIKRKKKIFGIKKSKEHRLDFVINKISESLSVYFVEKEGKFIQKNLNKGMNGCNDLKIIGYFYKDSLFFNAITKILDDESEFLITYLKYQLKQDIIYKEKVEANALAPEINTFIETMLNISNDKLYEGIKLNNNIDLKNVYMKFEEQKEAFNEEFQEYINESLISKEHIDIVNKSLMISNVISDKKILNTELYKKIEKCLEEQETEDDSQIMDLNDKLLSYIQEGWNN